MNDVYFENVRIQFCNFAGRESKNNAKGKRNFQVVIEDEEFAKQLADDGWNVRMDKLDKEGNPYPPSLKVIVGYPEGLEHLWPKVMVEQRGNKVYLTEDTIGTLDGMEIINVKALEIRPGKQYDINGLTGYPAYLRKMRVEVAPDMFCDD